MIRLIFLKVDLNRLDGYTVLTKSVTERVVHTHVLYTRYITCVQSNESNKK